MLLGSTKLTGCVQIRVIEQTTEVSAIIQVRLCEKDVHMSIHNVEEDSNKQRGVDFYKRFY